MHADLDKFVIKLSEKDIENEFNDAEWESDVARAAFLGAIYLTEDSDQSADEVIRSIIDYNIMKKLNKLVLSKANPLPSKYTWDNTIDKATAFDILENYVAQVHLLKETDTLDKPIKLKLSIRNKEIAQSLNKEYEYLKLLNQDLDITLKSITNTSYLFVFSKK